MIKPANMHSTPGAMDPLAALLDTRAPRDVAEAQKVALQFEGILLKEVVASMRKTATVTGEPSGGHPMYDQMMEQALTDHLAASGGVGLAQLFEPSLVRQTTTGDGTSESLFGDFNIPSAADMAADAEIFSPSPAAPSGPWDPSMPLSEQLPDTDDAWLDSSRVRDRLERILRAGDVGVGASDEKKGW